MRESIIKRLIELHPNDADLGDADLGKSIREMYRKRLYNRRTILRYAIWGSLFYLGVVSLILLLVLLNKY
jgi:hypothetical protein